MRLLSLQLYGMSMVHAIHLFKQPKLAIRYRFINILLRCTVEYLHLKKVKTFLRLPLNLFFYFSIMNEPNNQVLVESVDIRPFQSAFC